MSRQNGKNLQVVPQLPDTWEVNENTSHLIAEFELKWANKPTAF